MKNLTKGITSALLTTIMITGIGVSNIDAASTSLRDYQQFDSQDREFLKKWDEKFEEGRLEGRQLGNNMKGTPSLYEKRNEDFVKATLREKVKDKGDAFEAGFTKGYLETAHGVNFATSS